MVTNMLATTSTSTFKPNLCATFHKYNIRPNIWKARAKHSHLAARVSSFRIRTNRGGAAAGCGAFAKCAWERTRGGRGGFHPKHIAQNVKNLNHDIILERTENTISSALWSLGDLLSVSPRSGSAPNHPRLVCLRTVPTCAVATGKGDHSSGSVYSIHQRRGYSATTTPAPGTTPIAAAFGKQRQATTTTICGMARCGAVPV